MAEYPIIFSGPMVRAILDGKKTQTRRLDKKWLKVKKGDLLWVKETWMSFDIDHVIDDKCAYKASTSLEGEETRREYIRLGRNYQWRPSIFMPRRFSRITLEATEDAYEERLQDISIRDALCEGITCPLCGYTSLDAARYLDHDICIKNWLTDRGYTEDHGAIIAFRDLWDSINGKKRLFADNPKVGVLTFRQVEGGNG
ncbi:MAG: hypothetical protein KIT11_05650 [Fimbriimonadaceae bacterium]|nr:hypothetical protein [Fimbriimonadaceae bacterium]QYK56622.1 MAG: hypothetical protein KF733_03865 [Fimbriimonadaceae bacterium]